MIKFVQNLFCYQRRETNQVTIGNTIIGSNWAIRKQSMATTDTADVEASVEQCKRIVDAGGELVRFTTQGVKQAKDLAFIREQLLSEGYTQPLVADVHFVASAAFEAAQHIEKVRINPGNFADGSKRFSDVDLTPDEYEMELDRIKEKFVPLLEICQANKTAIRIGVNHGSLSDRIMSRYGDTAEGMVESCMEYLRIARTFGFDDIVISVKASNTRVMVHTVRLLVATMNKENLKFPLHLGVTEAGDGEDGRIKSAVGIGALLMDGIGDTIRVSLSEDPELEIPVCKTLVSLVESISDHAPIEEVDVAQYSPTVYQPRKTIGVKGVGGGNKPIVAISTGQIVGNIQPTPDFIHHSEAAYIERISTGEQFEVVDVLHMTSAPIDEPFFLKGTTTELRKISVETWKSRSDYVIIVSTDNTNATADLRAFVLFLMHHNITNPIIVEQSVGLLNEVTKIKVAAQLGLLFLDGLVDGIMFSSEVELPENLASVGFNLLQASRARFTKTEFISCPGCGRTLFNLQNTIAKVKAATSHLKGLKIGIMGCIVNGPGEMADADYGYVGAAKDKISLYKGKECIRRNISEGEAVETLITLLKENGDWVEPKK